MRFQCPFCKGIVSVDNTDLGIPVQCGHCNEVVTVPVSRVSPGAVIGDFIIMKELGRGGMGVVYLAHQMSLDRPAALKVLADSYANNAEFVVGFIKEARAAAKLNHPNIVQAYAVGEDEGIFYFAMENVDGETMKTVLRREKKISVEQALSIIQQIAEALDYAWKEQRLIHRDIKPDNIMLTSNGRAKLADLGLARVAGDIDDSEDDEVMGTPQYISPEHLTGAPMDVRSDLYSLGATFYHFVTGRFPFEGRTAIEIAKKHLGERLIPPHQVNREIPIGVSRIIEKMMAKNPKMRYQDAEQLVDDLRLARHGKEPVSATGTMTGLPSSIRQRSSLNSGRISGMRSSSGIYNTTTGPIGSVTSTHTRSGIYNLKRMREEQAKKRLVIIGIGVAAVALIATVTLILTHLSKKSGGTAVPKQTQTVTPAMNPGYGGGVQEPKNTAYSKKAAEILRYMQQQSGKSGSDNRIWQMCEDFFQNFPKPKYKIEEEALEKMLAVYIPIDERRMPGLRKSLRSQHFSEASERKTDYEREQTRVKEAAAEAERKKIEAEKRAEDLKRRQEQVRREVEEAKQELPKLYGAALQDMFTAAERGDYIKAQQAFDPIVKLSEDRKNNNIVLRMMGQMLEEMTLLKSGLKMADAVEQAVTDGGDLLAGNQVEFQGDMCRILSIKKGRMAYRTSGGIQTEANLSKLAPKQYEKLVRKALDKVPDGEANAYWLDFFKGDYETAMKDAPEASRQVLSRVLEARFRSQILGADSAEKAKLARRYGRMEEWKNAEKMKK